eukprot:gene31328-38399_t
MDSWLVSANLDRMRGARSGGEHASAHWGCPELGRCRARWTEGERTLAAAWVIHPAAGHPCMWPVDVRRISIV